MPRDLLADHPQPNHETHNASTPKKSGSSLKCVKHKSRKGMKVFHSNKCALVTEVFSEMGGILVDRKDDWIVAWMDFSICLTTVSCMKSFQRINHFPGMNEICRKDFLARNLNGMKEMIPASYDFFPETWCLPLEGEQLFESFNKKVFTPYIIKPRNSAQGRGIYLTSNISPSLIKKQAICQQYIRNPYLIDGLKFDLRLYVLVTSVDPLRIYLYNDGIARFATKHYALPRKKNLKKKYMHLTNYALNKKNSNFNKDEETGNKRSVQNIEKLLISQGYSPSDLWGPIEDLIIKTMLSALPALQHSFRACFPNKTAICPCFELLGFDILLTDDLKPMLLEVNHSPSLFVSTPVDEQVKKRLLRDALKLVKISQDLSNKVRAEEHRKSQSRLVAQPMKFVSGELTARERLLRENHLRHEETTLGNFRKIYPAANSKYDEIIQQQNAKLIPASPAKSPSSGSFSTTHHSNVQSRIPLRPTLAKISSNFDSRTKKKTPSTRSIPKQRPKSLLVAKNTSPLFSRVDRPSPVASLKENRYSTTSRANGYISLLADIGLSHSILKDFDQYWVGRGSKSLAIKTHLDKRSSVTTPMTTISYKLPLESRNQTSKSNIASAFPVPEKSESSADKAKRTSSKIRYSVDLTFKRKLLTFPETGHLYSVKPVEGSSNLTAVKIGTSTLAPAPIKTPITEKVVSSLKKISQDFIPPYNVQGFIAIPSTTNISAAIPHHSKAKRANASIAVNTGKRSPIYADSKIEPSYARHTYTSAVRAVVPPPIKKSPGDKNWSSTFKSYSPFHI